MSPQSLVSSSAVSIREANASGPLVLLDADNTLWDTDGVFAAAQLNLLISIEAALGLNGPTEERLSFVRAFDQELAEQHHLGLRYPPRLLVDALVYGVRGHSTQNAARRAWGQAGQSGLEPEIVEEIESHYLSELAKQPSLLKGVASGLHRLASFGATLVVLTEGSRKRIKRSIDYHNLGAYIDRVLEAPKTLRTFERVKAIASPSHSLYMIGDQLTRDIQPANQAGAKTIYIPGKFQPRWEVETGIQAHYQAGSFDTAATYIISSEIHLREK